MTQAPEVIHSAATIVVQRPAPLQRPDTNSQWLYPIISYEGATIQ